MPSFVLVVGCMLSATAFARGLYLAGFFLLAWHVVLALAAREARPRDL